MYKGVILHTVAKIVFVLSSYIIHFFLGKLMTPEEYGIVGVILTVINFDYLFLNNGVRQAISKAIAQQKYDINNTVKVGMVYQVIIIAVIFVINYFGAPFIAYVLKDDALVPYIKIAAFIIPATGIYFASLGVFNGFKLFVVEAAIITIYPTLKLLVLPFVKYVYEDPVVGTEMGFFAAALGVCIICIVILLKNTGKYKSNKLKPKVPKVEYLKSAFSFSLLFSISSIVMNLDTLIVKGFETDAVVGYYTGAVTFAKVPYFLLTPFFLVLLPVVSENYAKGKIKESAVVVRDFITVILVVILPMVTIISASSTPLLTCFYKPEYAVAGDCLNFLIFGTFLLGMVLIFCNILSAANKKKFVTLLSLFLLAVFVVSCVVFTMLWSINGTAVAAIFTCGICTVLCIKKSVETFGNIFCKKHLIIIVINIIMFILVAVLCKYVAINNLIVYIAVAAVIYLIHFGVLAKLKVITFKQIISALKKEKKNNE